MRKNSVLLRMVSKLFQEVAKEKQKNPETLPELKYTTGICFRVGELNFQGEISGDEWAKVYSLLKDNFPNENYGHDYRFPLTLQGYYQRVAFLEDLIAKEEIKEMRSDKEILIIIRKSYIGIDDYDKGGVCNVARDLRINGTISNAEHKRWRVILTENKPKETPNNLYYFPLGLEGYYTRIGFLTLLIDKYGN